MAQFLGFLFIFKLVFLFIKLPIETYLNSLGTNALKFSYIECLRLIGTHTEIHAFQPFPYWYLRQLLFTFCIGLRNAAAVCATLEIFLCSILVTAFS